MIVNSYKSKCKPEVNARILRGIEGLVCDYRGILPKGWRCCVEFQREGEDEPYYQLDVESNFGGGSFAPVKMAMLRMFPELSATGTASLSMITDALTDSECPGKFFTRLVKLHDINELTEDDWKQLKPLGITRWYGGIRVPYDILMTERDKSEQFVTQREDEIRITFSGAAEWQDTFFCFRLFQKIQVILNEMWDKDQIWYNLRDFDNDPALKFWVEALGVQEVPER